MIPIRSRRLSSMIIVVNRERLFEIVANYFSSFIIEVNYSLSLNNEVKIDDINKYDNKTDSLFELVKAQKESLIQQILLVKDGIAMKFSSKDKFQRRCICTKNDGGNFIIESLESITLSQFSIDLVALNIDAAIYTDMGSWDEGWYKSGPNLVKIGNSRKNTNKQCNWFLVKHK